MRKKIAALVRGQKGIGFLETLIALAIMGAIGGGFLQALTTTSQATAVYEERVTASNVAQSQVEYVKSTDYVADGSYAVGIDLPAHYTVSMEIADQQVGRHEVIVKVYHCEEFVLEMKTLKVDW